MCRLSFSVLKVLYNGAEIFLQSVWKTLFLYLVDIFMCSLFSLFWPQYSPRVLTPLCTFRTTLLTHFFHLCKFLIALLLTFYLYFMCLLGSFIDINFLNLFTGILLAVLLACLLTYILVNHITFFVFFEGIFVLCLCH